MKVKKKVTPTFCLEDPINTSTHPIVEEVDEIDFKPFKNNKKEAEKYKERSPFDKHKKKSALSKLAKSNHPRTKKSEVA